MVYRDTYITLFNDEEKCLAVFVNDRGQTKVINYDDNFYSVEDDILAYDELIRHATSDEKEQQEYLHKFIDFVRSFVGDKLNTEFLRDRGIKI